MFYRVTQRSDVAVVTLKEAKGQLNIVDGEDEGVDDSHIQLLIDASVELAESYTKRLFTPSTVELSVSGQRSFFLPCGNVESVTSAVVTGDNSDAPFTFNPISQIFTFGDNFDFNKDVTITYDAGYTVLPLVAKMGVMMLLSSLDENRVDTVTGLTAADISLNSTAILNSIKLGYF